MPNESLARENQNKYIVYYIIYIYKAGSFLIPINFYSNAIYYCLNSRIMDFLFAKKCYKFDKIYLLFINKIIKCTKKNYLALYCIV